MISLESFARLVRSMRQAQAAYFRSRDSTDLQTARNWEKHVDAAAQEILAPPQPSLFPTTPDERNP